MLNAIWITMVLVALVVGATQNKLDSVAKAVVDSASGAVTLAIGLVGIMALFLGLMRVLQEGGLLRTVARWLKPIMVRLFPDVPAEHPAMSMMILNFTANMLGLANAATPFGLKAMNELDKLNKHKGIATNAMILFLAINTSNLALFPTGVIGLRASLGSNSPASIFLTTLLATAISTGVAIILTKLFIAFAPAFAPTVPTVPDTIYVENVAKTVPDTIITQQNQQVNEATAIIEREPPKASTFNKLIGWIAVFAILATFSWAAYERSLYEGWSVALRSAFSNWMLLLLIAAFVLYGVIRGVKVYDAIVEGGKEGFTIALRIIPFLVAILVAVGMLRSSGALDLFVNLLAPVTNFIGMPPETLPMALLRPLSGSGAYGVAAETMKNYGTDSLIGTIVSTMQGSTETTFYVLAVYFGAVNVRNTRFTIMPCLLAEASGIIASVWACRLILF